MKVAITGSNGDLGGALRSRYPAYHTLRCIDVKHTSPFNDGIEYLQADVCDLQALTNSIRGVDAVVHLAAIRSPDGAPPQTVFGINAQGTYNLTLACASLGINKIIFASSICYYGYIFRKGFASPAYFPVDESTRPEVEDSYSLSKLIGENVMSAFVQRTGGSVISLRFAYLMRHGAAGSPDIPAAMADMPSTEGAAKSWWTYVDLDDAATSVWLALDYITNTSSVHEAFNIGADDTHTTTPTIQLLAQFFPGADNHFVSTLASTPHLALFSNHKARELLHFRPSEPTWRVAGNTHTEYL